MIALALLIASAAAADMSPKHFDINDAGVAAPSESLVRPWKVVPLDEAFGGQWLIAGDVDGDGEAELISAENHNEGDVHYTSAVAAQELDGAVLWTWGDPDIGRKTWHHDVACQIHDWDGDGTAEVVVLARDALVELDGKTGAEKRRFPIPAEAADCLVFCNLSGGPRPAEVLVKNRYQQIWAYSHEGELMWTVENPGGYRTAHQPLPVDVDGDGKDEIVAGYALLNSDGTIRWTYKSGTVDQGAGHLDCARVVRIADTPEDTRLVLTCCGANNIAMVDGNGKPVWEVPGAHFESVDVGRVLPGEEGSQVVVDVDHQPEGKSPIWILGGDGAFLGRINGDYSRHHALVDWNGDGYDEVVVAHNGAVYGHAGSRIATLELPGAPAPNAREYETSVVPAEMTGDGRCDLILVTPERAYVFRNESTAEPRAKMPLGSGMNFTLY